MPQKDDKSIAHKGLWQQLLQLEPQETAKRAKCKYTAHPDRYIVTLLNTEYAVNLSDKRIFSVQSDLPEVPATFIEQLCILAYLISARDLPLAGKLVRAEELPAGQFFFRGLHSLPTDKLAKAFGDCPERLYRITEQFAANKCEFGDASAELYVLPRVPIAMIIWAGDDEFDARASILFDQTAASQLPLDALLSAVRLAVDAVIRVSRRCC